MHCVTTNIRITGKNYLHHEVCSCELQSSLCRGTVKLLKKLDMRLSESGYMKRWGLFYCPHCKQKVERVLADVVNNKFCGCAQHSIIAATNKIHGYTPESLYRRWVTLKNKCYNPNNKWFKDCGGKCIKVCDERCESFESFRDWAMEDGYQEPGFCFLTGSDVLRTPLREPMPGDG